MDFLLWCIWKYIDICDLMQLKVLVSPWWHFDFKVASITQILFRSICFSSLLMRIVILNGWRSTRQDSFWVALVAFLVAFLVALRAQGFRQKGSEQDLGTKPPPQECNTSPHQCIVAPWGIASVPQSGQQMSSFNENNNLIFLSNNILEDVLSSLKIWFSWYPTKMSWAKIVK